MTTTIATETTTAETDAEILVCEIDVYVTGRACSACAALIDNGDESDMDPDTIEEANATIAAIARDNGGPVVTQRIPDWIGDPGAVTCGICGDVTYRPTALIAVITG